MNIFCHPTGLLGRLGGMIMARSHRRMAQRAIKLLDIQPGDRVLEIGFGPGVGIHLIASSTAALQVSGVDASDEMLDQAQARNTNHIEAGRVALRRGAVERMAFDDATFDKALAIRSMQLWSDPCAGLREIRRVLRPGGSLVLGFTRRSGQTRDGLRKLLTAAGFADAAIVGAGGVFFALTFTRPG